MTDETKEILDNFKIYEDRYKKCNETQFIIFYKDIHLLLDYITNLQQENKAKTHQIEVLEEIVNYERNIRNDKLQQENEKLKYNARGQVNDYFKDKYADEVLKNADLIKDFELTCYKNYELKEENERLNNIINTFEEDLEREVNISEQESMVESYKYTVIHSTLEKMLKYFKELKESGNNED